MPFPRKLLTEGEAVVVELRKSWLFLGWPLVAASAAVVLMLALLIAFNVTGGWLIALTVIVLVPLLWLGARALRWQTTSIVITTNRIIERSGVLTRQGIEIRLERINETSYRQSLIGRVLRAGQVMVEVGGEAGVVVFDHMTRPAAVQSLITEQIAALRRRQGLGFAAAPAEQPVQGAYPPGYASAPAYAPAPYAPPPAAAPAPAPAPVAANPTVAERLVQLDDLRKRGIVSADEYESKRQELLRQL